MPACSAHVRAEPAHLLLGDLDRIEAASADPLCGSAELAERMPCAAEDLRVLFGEEPRSDVAAVLLVGEDHEHERRRRAGLVRGEECRHEHRHAALHVERAASPHVAVGELGRERRPAPLLAGGGDDVDVALEHERRPAVRPGVARNEVGAARRLLVALGGDPVLSQQRFDVRDARLLVSGRVRRVVADQLAQQLDGVGHSSSRAWSRRSTSAGVL